MRIASIGGKREVHLIELYPIIEVPADAAHEDEQMGTKPKFWYQDSGGTYWLFKQARPDTGEDWAEKIASELARLVGLPCAAVELASSHDVNGCVSRKFLEPSEVLIHGNELLYWTDRDYPRASRYHVATHTFDRVVEILSNPRFRPPRDSSAPESVQTTVDAFLGYLVLDAWIGNTDRHHENWGLVLQASSVEPLTFAPTAHLAPTFDHASSLGRELQDERRELLMREERVDGYAAKCRSAMYAQEADQRPLATMDLVRKAGERWPQSSSAWLDAVIQTDEDRVRRTIAAVPDTRMTEIAKRFVEALLICNRKALRDLGKEIQA